MEIVEQELATVEQADAYQSGDVLIVRVAGKRPTACHIVSIERSLLDVEPPAFAVRMRIDPRARCMWQEADFEVAQAFRIGGDRPEVVVHHSGGELTVEVSELSVDGDADRRAPGPLSGLVDGAPVTAFGYSRDYDLAEAVRAAVSQLPDRGAGIPDFLNTYSIVSMDVEIGGIGGWNHLKVTAQG